MADFEYLNREDTIAFLTEARRWCETQKDLSPQLSAELEELMDRIHNAELFAALLRTTDMGMVNGVRELLSQLQVLTGHIVPDEEPAKRTLH